MTVDELEESSKILEISFADQDFFHSLQSIWKQVK